MSHQTELDKTQTAFLFQEESLAVHPYLHTLPRKESCRTRHAAHACAS